MDAGLKRKFAGAAAGVALLAGAGGAIAASNGGSGATRADGRDAFLNDVAKRLHVTPQALKDAFLGALSDRLDADVKAGRLTRAQADEILKHARSEDAGVPFGFGFHGPPPPGGPGEPPPPFPGPPPGRAPHGPPGLPPGPGAPGPIGAGFSGADDYLGLTPDQLRQRLESGKSLAQIARDEHKSVDGLKSAIEAAVKKDLDKAVADKRLTQKQADDILAGLHDRLDDIVNRKPGDRPPRPPRFRHRGHW
jgi:hypothetical protein